MKDCINYGEKKKEETEWIPTSINKSERIWVILHEVQEGMGHFWRRQSSRNRGVHTELIMYEHQMPGGASDRAQW